MGKFLTGHQLSVGQQHAQAKLNDADIPVIRSLLKAGKSYRQIAIKYRVTTACIQAIKEGRTWTHIPAENVQDSSSLIKSEKEMQSPVFQGFYNASHTQAPGPATLSNISGGEVESDTPALLTKKWICWRFGIAYDQPATCNRLRRLIFDDVLLARLNMSEQDWKRRREFTRAETLIIKQYLQI